MGNTKFPKTVALREKITKKPLYIKNLIFVLVKKFFKKPRSCTLHCLLLVIRTILFILIFYKKYLTIIIKIPGKNRTEIGK